MANRSTVWVYRDRILGRFALRGVRRREGDPFSAHLASQVPGLAGLRALTDLRECRAGRHEGHGGGTNDKKIVQASQRRMHLGACPFTNSALRRSAAYLAGEPGQLEAASRERIIPHRGVSARHRAMKRDAELPRPHRASEGPKASRFAAARHRIRLGTSRNRPDRSRGGGTESRDTSLAGSSHATCARPGCCRTLGPVPAGGSYGR